MHSARDWILGVRQWLPRTFAILLRRVVNVFPTSSVGWRRHTRLPTARTTSIKTRGMPYCIVSCTKDCVMISCRALLSLAHKPTRSFALLPREKRGEWLPSSSDDSSPSQLSQHSQSHVLHVLWLPARWTASHQGTETLVQVWQTWTFRHELYTRWT